MDSTLQWRWSEKASQLFINQAFELLAGRCSSMAAANPRLLLALLLLVHYCSGAASSSNLTITCYYPDSQISALGGHFLSLRGVGGCDGWSWQAGQYLTRVGKDTHQLSCSSNTNSIAQQVAEFKILIDDQLWMRGSNAVATVPSGSAPNNVDVYPFFNATQGTIHVIESVGRNSNADIAGVDPRDVAVYLPPSYMENTLKPYSSPVLVAHDGQNLFDSNTCRTCCPFGCWGLDGKLDALVEAGDSEMVVVGIYNTQSRMDDYTYSQDPQYPNAGGHLDEYLDYIEGHVLPTVASQLPRLTGALPSAAPWPMMGSSLGGLASCYAGWTRSRTWNPAICMSSSFWWNSRDFLGSRVLDNQTDHPDPPSRPALTRSWTGPEGRHSSPRQRFWVDYGSAESSDQTGSNAAVIAKLESKGWTTGNGRLGTYIQPGGTHSEASWGARVGRPLEWLQRGDDLN